MMFNGVHATSFGRVKVTSWRNSFHTDFDRQEITSRGMIRAAIEVPTVRNIEADFLVKGKSITEIAKTLTDMASWLFNAGMAKLSVERNPNVYFKARCASVSTPEYNGRSARFTATFVCDDYRPYNSRTNQPLISADSDLSNFTFAGKHCLNDMGCIFVEDSRDAIPKVMPNTYPIAGVSGTLRYSNGMICLEEKSLSGTLYFVASNVNELMSDIEIANHMHEVASWLINAERASLVFDSDTGRSYDAEVIDAATLSKKNWQNGVLKVKFVLQPICKEIQVKTKSSALSLQANTEMRVALNDLFVDGIGFITPLKIEVTNSGGATVTDLSIGYYDEKNVKKTMRLNGAGFAVSRGQKLTIDGSTYMIFNGSTEGIKWLKSGDFPIVAPGGTKSITFKASTSSTLAVTASCNVRWV